MDSSFLFSLLCSWLSSNSLLTYRTLQVVTSHSCNFTRHPPHSNSMISYYNKIKQHHHPNSNGLPGLTVPFPIKPRLLSMASEAFPSDPNYPFNNVCLLPILHLRLQPLQMPTISQHMRAIQGSGHLVCHGSWMSPNFFTCQAHSSNHLNTNIILKT